MARLKGSVAIADYSGSAANPEPEPKDTAGDQPKPPAPTPSPRPPTSAKGPAHLVELFELVPVTALDEHTTLQRRGLIESSAERRAGKFPYVWADKAYVKYLVRDQLRKQDTRASIIIARDNPAQLVSCLVTRPGNEVVFAYTKEDLRNNGLVRWALEAHGIDRQQLIRVHVWSAAAYRLVERGWPLVHRLPEPRPGKAYRAPDPWSDKDGERL